MEGVMLDKAKQTTITRIGRPKSIQTNTNKESASVDGSASFEEFMSKQANLTDSYNRYHSTKKNPIETNTNSGDNDGIDYENGTATLCDIFKKASEKYGVPYNLLVAVAKAESDFNEKCTSHSGAMGIMQLMPGTAKYLGVKDAYNPEQNIMGGARYLSEKMKEQGGNVTLALAAYNAGSGAVKKYGGVPPYKETQNYVKKVTKYMESSIKVPDKSFSVTFANSSQKTNAQTVGSASKNANGNDIDQAIVIVGEGENGISLTYEAYQRYLELLNTGVG